MRAFRFIALLGILGCASAARPAAELPPPEFGAAQYVRAHLDRLDPAKVKQFDDARKEWLAARARQQGTDPWWGTFFEVEGLGFLSLRPVASLGDLRRQVADGPQSPERAKAVDRYNRMSDEGLVFPHMSQVWSPEHDLSYQPPGAKIELSASGWGRIVFEGVSPTRSDDYEKGWKAIHQALAVAHYPLARFTFSSLYGDGRVVSIWLGPDEHPREIEAVLAETLGTPRASELLRVAREPVVSTENYSLRARPDLSDHP